MVVEEGAKDRSTGGSTAGGFLAESEGKSVSDQTLFLHGSLIQIERLNPVGSTGFVCLLQIMLWMLFAMCSGSYMISWHCMYVHSSVGTH